MTEGPALADRNDEQWLSPAALRHVRTASRWRAAAFLMLGACVVAMIFSMRLFRMHDEMARIQLDQDVGTRIAQQVQPDLLALANDASTLFIPMRAVQDAPAGFAHAMVFVMYDEQEKTAYLLGTNLPRQQSLTIRAITPDGEETLARAFETRFFASGVRVGTVGLAELSNLTWEVTTATGTIVLRSV